MQNAVPTGSPRWYLRLLGRASLEGGQSSELHRWPSRAALLLLTRLALWPRRAHPREELVELLWPGVDADVGRNRLRQVLSTLRALLEPPGAPPVLQADRHALRLLPGALGCDAHDFERLLAGHRDAEAAALYAGELLPGLYDDWVADERLRLEALRDRLQARHEATPEPMPTAPAALSRPRPGALPRYLTRFFADDIALSRLRVALDAAPALVLRGPGGAGKTRCAVELMRGLPADVPVHFADLAACTDTEAMAAAVASALPPPPDPGWPLHERLAATDGWLVLDNFEQLPSDADGLLGRWLQTSPLLRVLVTSRRALAVDGLVELEPPRLSPLPGVSAAPEDLASQPAVALFVDRARAVRPDFHLHAGNASAVLALVTALESLPLALELAAARVRSLPPAELLSLLTQGSGAPHLDLVGRARRAGTLVRQASLRAVVDWSWRLLPPTPSALAATLGNLSAPFTRGLAQTLADPGLTPVALAEALDDLVAHSLVQRLPDGHPDEPTCFAMAVPVQQFALLQCSPEARQMLRQRLRQGLLDWAASWPATPPLAEARVWLPHLAMALDAADAAFARAWLGAWRPALQHLPLDPPIMIRLSTLCADGPADAVALATLAWQWHLAGQLPEARRQACRALRAARRGEPAARTLARWTCLALDWRDADNPRGLRRRLDRALAAAPADAPGLRSLLLQIDGAMAELREHDPARCGLRLQEALAAARASGNAYLQLACRYRLASWLARRGPEAEAMQALDEAARQAGSLGDREVLSSVFNSRGNLQLRLRRPAAAADSFRDAVRQAWAVRSGLDLAYALWNLSCAWGHLPGQAARAVSMLAFAAAWWDRHYGRLTPAERRFVRRVRQRAALRAGADAARRLWVAGEAWTLDEAVAQALAND